MRPISPIFATLFCLALSACSTLVSDAPPHDYSPESLSASREGVVAYNPSGMVDIVQARRDDAYHKIVDFCGSRRYKITKEVTVAAADSKSKESLATFGADNIRELHFVCDKSTTH